MTDRPTQLALRQMRAHLAQPTTLVALVGTTFVLSLAAPFGMEGTLGMLGRISYWAVTVFGSYAIGTAVFTALSVRGLAQRSGLLFCAVGAGMTAALVTLLVLVANALWLGLGLGGDGDLEYVGMIFLVALIVSLMIAYVSYRNNQAEIAASPAPAAPRLLERLPVDKRGAIVALSAEDHYVRVRTTRAEELVLMRLTDAIAEAAPTPGLKVHRSHWVALDHVEQVNRAGERAVILIRGGVEIPVSRGQMTAVRDAGLLAKTGRG